MLAPTITDPTSPQTQDAAHQFLLSTFTGGEQFYATIVKLTAQHGVKRAVWQLSKATRRIITKFEFSLWTALAMRAQRLAVKRSIKCN